MEKQFVVGGAVRDVLKGIIPKDMDFVWVNSSHEKMVTRGFSRVGASFPVYLDAYGQEHALARRERKTGVGYLGFECEVDNVPLVDDLMRRDLTINSMAVAAHEWEIFLNTIDVTLVVDPFGGIGDLRCGILRHTSPAFSEDSVRVLRTARFAARYDFEVHPDTLVLMEKVAPELEFVPKERIWAEFEKGLGEKFPDKMGDVLWKCKAMSLPILRPYNGWGHRGLTFADSDTLISRFAILGGNFRDDDYETYKIPTDFVRVRKALADHGLVLSAWPYASVDDRLKVLSAFRAFNDPKLMFDTMDALDIWRRQDCSADWMKMIRAFVENDLRVAKIVDTEAIAKMAPSPKQIGQLIHNARCEALEQDPDCRQKVLVK